MFFCKTANFLVLPSDFFAPPYQRSGLFRNTDTS